MEKINFQDNITPANAETMNTFQNNIEKAINEVLNIVCPIGKVEIFFDNEDHSNYLGFTWERTSIGKTPIGIDEDDTDFNVIGKTGGEKEHTLTVAELAEHDHETEGHYSYYGEGPSTATLLAWGSGTALVQKAGGGQAHNNLQPYEVVAFWKRVA